MPSDVLTPETLIHCGVPSALAHKHVPLMMPAMREHAITTRARARMFIAQVLEESARLQFFEEIASGAEYEGRRDLGNTHPGDGRRYKGRGPIQLTGRTNYRNYGKRLGLDLEGQPAIAARPSVGWRIAALYFQINCNAAADAGNFEQVTRNINGGLRGYSVRQQYYRQLDGRGVLPGRPYLRVGDHGQAIVTMTRRLSHLRSPTTGKVYLDGKRQTFDEESAHALRRFQADHKLHVDGHFGPKSAQALARAIERAKAGHPARPPQPGKPAKPVRRRPKPAPAKHPATAVELIARMDTLDARSDRLLRALERRRHVLQQMVAHGGAGAAESEVEDLEARVAKLELSVGAIRTELTTVESGGTVHTAPSASAPGGTVTAVITQAQPVVATPETNGHDLAHASLAELAAQLATLSREGDRIRAVMLERYTAIEHAAGTVDPPRHPAPPVQHKPHPAPVRPRPVRPKPGPAPQPAKPGTHAEDGHDGSAGATRPGGRAWPIRQSKLAVQRYLKAKDPAGTLKLRRKLQRDRLSPRRGRSATPVWKEAITAAQKLAGLPETGQLDGQVVRLLRPYWPPETPQRRVVKGTPAWRLIPGQLTKNFNIREFACHDGTAYVAGLVREQGITKQQAKARAKELAKRLEHLRTIEGGKAIRPTSVFRTKAYNAHVGGSAKNSAHTRGFAADVPPPPGITLQAHKQHVRAAFESGVGYYVQMHFVHGDFDPKLGRREWNGP